MTVSVTTAMVLAAGLGTRMRPLTDTRPKPLIEVLGHTLIDRTLDHLVEAGVTRAVVNVHYLAEQLVEHLARRSVPEIVISDERDQLLETGGGVVRALRNGLVGPDPFLITNSDAIWTEGVESNLCRLMAAWDPQRMDSLMLLASTATSVGYDGRGDFTMGPNGRLSRRGEREVAPFVFTGVSIAHPRMFDAAPDGPFSLNRLWDAAIGDGRLYGMQLKGRWMHVGTPQGLADAEAAILAAADDGDND